MKNKSRQQLECQKSGFLKVYVDCGHSEHSAGGDRCSVCALLMLHQVILKGERGRGRSGEMAVDDIALRKGSCAEEHNLRRL